MAGYSIWYYSYKKTAGIPSSGLYNQYQKETDPNDPLTSNIPWVDDVTAREVIARTHEYSYYNTESVVNLIFTFSKLIPEDTGLLLISVMKITGHPQMLEFKYASGGIHAVTVYKYDGNAGTFYIYDNDYPASAPNYPTGGITVQWDPNNGFSNYNDPKNYYGTITQFALNAISSFSTPGSFEPIYQQAASGGWSSQDSWFKTINISSPQLDVNNTAVITQNQDVTVNGSFINGLISPATYLIYYVNGVKQTPIAVDSTGVFSFTVPSGLLTKSNNILDLFAANSNLGIDAYGEDDEWRTYAGFKEVKLVAHPSNVGASSQYWPNESGNDKYSVYLCYTNPNPPASTVSVSGPGITGSQPLTYNTPYTLWDYSLALGTTLPTLPLTYTFTITDTSTWTTTATVSCFMQEYATNLSPTGTITTATPTFTWTGISASDAQYQVQLNDSYGNRIWNSNTSSSTSVVYNGPSLVSGNSYSFNVGTNSDSTCKDGGSVVYTSFTYQPLLNYLSGSKFTPTRLRSGRSSYWNMPQRYSTKARQWNWG